MIIEFLLREYWYALWLDHYYWTAWAADKDERCFMANRKRVIGIENSLMMNGAYLKAIAWKESFLYCKENQLLP